MYADVIVDISHEAIDKTFEYEIPDELLETIQVGQMVSIPFGNAKKPRTGYVIGIKKTSVYDPEKIKALVGVVESATRIDTNLIKLAEYIRVNYGGTMIDALKTVMPVKESVRAVKGRVEESAYEIDKKDIVLSPAQKALVDEFSDDYESYLKGEASPSTYLLKGITGSGKTEVYIECIKEVVKSGGQAILLIPEIGLTYQTKARLYSHFGDRVAIINSKQSKGEKYREFEKARKHEVDVVVGPRSALFTPCEKLGLIIIDEEHDSAYKSETTPRYVSRNVAKKRCELEGAALILGSATPTLESYQYAKDGVYKLWELNERPDGAKLATVNVVNMADELMQGNRSIISQKLQLAIANRLENKEQVMLFINRRGYNSFMSCRECGEAIKCPKCDVTLTLHEMKGRKPYLSCHYCGYQQAKPTACPKCSSKMIAGFGTGTEKVEQEIKRLFPEARTLRLDKDTTTRKNDLPNILSRFNKGEADILVGTQMIVKGHDFANVTLVGVILADLSLFANDYMATERTFGLLTQAAGRAGRGSKPGEVIVQSYKTNHYAIQTAVNQDYDAFFETEMTYRRLLKYPPVVNMLLVMMTGPNYEELVQASKDFSEELAEEFETEIEDKSISIVGPSDALIGRINDIFRRVLYIKSNDLAILEDIRLMADARSNEDIKIFSDINPLMMQ